VRSILVLNPKGGCGKSILAINIAGYFAQRGKRGLPWLVAILNVSVGIDCQFARTVSLRLSALVLKVEN